jgi:lipopolysaccharide export system protein LptA
LIAQPSSHSSGSNLARICSADRWLRGAATAWGLTLSLGTPLWALPGGSGVASISQAGPPSPITKGSSAPQATRNGLVTIESDQQQADNVTGVVTAIGNVRITYPDRGMVATARQAQYYTREGRLVLSGDVDIIDRDGQRLRADQIVYLLNGQRLLALPAKGQQVHTRLRFDVKSGASSPRPLLP